MELKVKLITNVSRDALHQQLGTIYDGLSDS